MFITFILDLINVFTCHDPLPNRYSSNIPPICFSTPAYEKNEENSEKRALAGRRIEVVCNCVLMSKLRVTKDRIHQLRYICASDGMKP